MATGQGYVEAEGSKGIPAVVEHLKDFLTNAEFQWSPKHVAAIAVVDQKLRFCEVMEIEIGGRKRYCFHSEIGGVYPKDVFIVERILESDVPELVIRGTGKYEGRFSQKPLKEEDYWFYPGGKGYYSLSEAGLVDVCPIFVARNEEYHQQYGDKILCLQPARSPKDLFFGGRYACCDMTIELHADGNINII